MALCLLLRKGVYFFIDEDYLIETFNGQAAVFKGQLGDCFKLEAEKWSCFEDCSWKTAGVAIVQPAAAPLSWCSLIFPC